MGQRSGILNKQQCIKLPYFGKQTKNLALSQGKLFEHSSIVQYFDCKQIIPYQPSTIKHDILRGPISLIFFYKCKYIVGSRGVDS